MREYALLCALAALAATASPSAQASRPNADAVRAAHERALENPFDEGRFREFLSTLPKDGPFFVVEGDLLFTEAEVRQYLAAQSMAQGRPGIRPELVVNLHEGQRDFYFSAEERVLGYYVDRASFANEDQFARVRTALQRATEDWQTACPECQIKFIMLANAPVGNDTRRAFIVRQVNANGSYIAAAFFPHDPPPRRVLRIDPSFYTTSFDSVGVLRHELGHVLGYRHEHTRGVPGCNFEDNRWQPLTAYDPHSVMHYFCGGGGSMRLAISRTDVNGHRALYGGVSPSPSGFAGQAPVSQRAAETLQAWQAAQADPFDEAKRRALLAKLPRVGNYFIVEGDIRLTEPELTAYLAAAAASPAPTQRTPELLVNLHRGAPDFYPLDRRTLTYVVDRASFGNAARYKEALDAVEMATKEWESICSDCRIVFRHQQEFDDKPAAANANFTVRLLDAGGEFIAAAFFPHDPPARRFVDIDPSFYTTTFDRVGVLRHELGHVLGYRHEHIRGVPGCFREDNQWRPLTPYDPRSVMHYFCGGAGNLKLEISAVDRTGHRQLYAPPRPTTAQGVPPPPPAVAGVLVVALEGGNVIDNAASVLRILNELKALPIDTHTVVKGESLESIYREHLGLPSFSQSVLALANELNGRREWRHVGIGDTVKVPELHFTAKTFGKVAPKEQADRIEQQWQHVLVEKGRETAKGYERIELRSYELRVPFNDATVLRRARERANELGANVIAAIEPARTTAQAQYYSSDGGTTAADTQNGVTSVDKLLANASNLAAGDEASILSMLGVTELPGKRVCEGIQCPEVVLADRPLLTHPDFKDAVPGENPDRTYENESLLQNGRQTLQVIDWNKAYHATHLTGIIGARQNGFGLVGVDPQARIIWWNWDALSDKPSEVANKISLRQSEANGTFQIYVFATRWQTDKHINRTARINRDMIAKRLDSEKPLVVAAAGEPDREEDDPEEISFATARGPMNLGDLPHVLVVTGCHPCRAPGARILPRANFSREFVHVAAPAQDLLSTASGAKYTKGTGTSQATAFVAGLASAMVARYPDTYKLASQVKTRLQVSSTPIELVGTTAGDGDKLATGVVDPELAVLDPRKHWLKTNGGNRTAYGMFQWKVRTVDMNIDGVDEPIAAGDIWRIVTRDGKSVVYTGVKAGPVKKHGPGVLSVAEPGKAVAAADQTDVKLSQIEDLLLRNPLSGR